MIPLFYVVRYRQAIKCVLIQTIYAFEINVVDNSLAVDITKTDPKPNYINRCFDFCYAFLQSASDIFR